MKIAVKAYYNGRNFRGSQIQPGVRTVEGEILRAISKFGGRSLKSAGRTDAGVSSLANVFSFILPEMYPLRAINAYLPEDIIFWSYVEVPEDFNPRYADMRVYKYFLYDNGLSMIKIKKACKIFEGTHSFHNFAKLEPHRNTVRELFEVNAEKYGDIIVLTFSGGSFLWQMVRRMTTAINYAGMDKIEISDIEEALKPGTNIKFPPAPPENLVLWDVKYNFDFKYDKKSLEILWKKFNRYIVSAVLEENMYKNMLESVI